MKKILIVLLFLAGTFGFTNAGGATKNDGKEIAAAKTSTTRQKIQRL